MQFVRQLKKTKQNKEEKTKNENIVEIERLFTDNSCG